MTGEAHRSIGPPQLHGHPGRRGLQGEGSSTAEKQRPRSVYWVSQHGGHGDLSKSVFGKLEEGGKSHRHGSFYNQSLNRVYGEWGGAKERVREEERGFDRCGWKCQWTGLGPCPRARGPGPLPLNGSGGGGAGPELLQAYSGDQARRGFQTREPQHSLSPRACRQLWLCLKERAFPVVSPRKSSENFPPPFGPAGTEKVRPSKPSFLEYPCLI